MMKIQRPGHVDGGEADVRVPWGGSNWEESSKRRTWIGMFNLKIHGKLEKNEIAGHLGSYL